MARSGRWFIIPLPAKFLLAYPAPYKLGILVSKLGNLPYLIREAVNQFCVMKRSCS